jgi:aspartyl-tRNA(Asn)/glutamyl-tRNA(Gln) amidotransferase subunit A
VRPAVRPVSELTAALADGELTSRALTEDSLARIDELNPTLNVFLHTDAEGALAAADASDARRAKGKSNGPLDGIPYALKDNIVARGLPNTCASKILGGFVSPYDATLVARLRSAGAVLIGKVNLDEFAMGSSNEHSAFGPTRNPHDPAYVPGGSSGASCAAVAGGLVPIAFGSETGGSVRLPASFCGVVGLKPSYGRISRYGLVAFGSSLDQIGPVARTVDGVAEALAVVAGLDPLDATTNTAEVPPAPRGSGSLAGRRVGVLRELLGEGCDPEVVACIERAAATCESLGATLVDVSLPNAKYGVAVYYVVSSAEASSNLARFDGARYGFRADGVRDLEELYTKSRSLGFGDEVKRRIMIGTFALSSGYYDAYYGRAMKARALIRDDYARAFAFADVLLSPVSPTPAFRLGERMDDPLAMYLTDAMTIPANLAGVPAISLPGGVTSTGLPIGVQLQAPFLREDVLLETASALETGLGVGPLPALAAESAA